MCGRYRLSRRKQILEERFDASFDVDDWVPRYNIAPTQPVPVLRQHPKEPRRVLSLMRWGLIPSWSKDMSGAASMINARSESAATRPAFRDPMRFRRCLLPADGFYEWRRTGTPQPYCFELDDGQPFAFAGLWDGWRGPGGQWIKSCSILTTSPNSLAAAIHDRMPVILDRSDYDLWLDPGLTDLEAVSDLLKPFDANRMHVYPVSARINQVANDDEACSEPAEITESQPGLFET